MARAISSPIPISRTRRSTRSPDAIPTAAHHGCRSTPRRPRHVLDEQLGGIPDIYHLAAKPAAESLFGQLRRVAADVDQAMAAIQELGS
jgi:hypothetical protein